MDRAKQIQKFISSCGTKKYKISQLKQDASTRTYYRIFTKNGNSILMDNPDIESDKSFIKIGERLQKISLSTPKVFKKNLKDGFLLIEDFGDLTFTKAIQRKVVSEGEAYSRAIDILIHTRKNTKKNILKDLSVFGKKRLIKQITFFLDWYLQLINVKLSTQAYSKFLELWSRYLSKVNTNYFTFKDYHAENLMWLANRNGIQSCGILDFQDAAKSHYIYDIVSLLQDARRDVGTQLENRMKKRYLSAFPKTNKQKFESIYALLSVQRHITVLGIFARLFLKDGKKSYLKHIPRIWHLLGRDLENPNLKSIKIWFKENIPNQTKIIRA